MKHADYEALWKRALIGGEDVSHELGVLTSRLALYQRYVRGHYERALKKIFRRMNKFLKPDWRSWAQEYYELYPPEAFDLNDLCMNFPEFLETKVKSGEVENYIVELAQYELTEFYVYKHSLEATPVSDGLIRLNPASQCLVFTHDVATWVAQGENSGKGLEGEPELKSNVLMVSRAIGGELCQFTQLSLIGIQFVQILEDGPHSPEELEQKTWESLKDVPGLTNELMRKELEFLKNQSVLF